MRDAAQPDRLAGHAEELRAGLVLREDDTISPMYRERAVSPVAAVSGENDGERPRSEHARGRGEQRIHRRPRVVHGRRVIERQHTPRAHAEVSVRRRYGQRATAQMSTSSAHRTESGV